MGKFIENIRSNQIASPIQPKFNKSIWLSADKTDNDDLYIEKVGIIFYEQLKQLRDDLDDLQKLQVNLPKRVSLRYFIGLSNRDFSIIYRNNSDYSENGMISLPIINNKKFQNNPLGNNYSIEDIAQGCVDGILYNILFHINDKNEYIEDSNDYELIESFIRGENILSQLYNLYEQNWNSILYEQLHFDIENKKFIENKKIAINYKSSYLRDQQIRINDAIIDSIIENDKSFKNKEFLIIDNNTFHAVPFESLDEKLKLKIELSYSSFFSKPNSYLDKSIPNLSFELDDVFQVFCQLQSITYSLFKHTPEDDSYSTSECYKLLDFAPTLSKSQLESELNNILKHDNSGDIINFLTFVAKSTPKADLWRMPIIELDNDILTFCFSSILSPNYVRCLEGWIQQGGGQIDAKGPIYEENTKNDLRSIIDKNSFIDKNEFFILSTPNNQISIDGTSEEFDLLLKIDNLIIVGEMKCIVTPDSAISTWNCYSTLQRACNQVIRKMKFIENNINEISSRFKWKKAESEIIFAPIILNSNRLFCGSELFNVPIIDHTILIDYFKGPIYDLYSINDLKLTSVELYKNPTDLKNNFKKYVEYPPSLEIFKKFIIPDENYIKIISPIDDYKPCYKYTRVNLNTPTSPIELTKIDFKFKKIINPKVQTQINQSFLPFLK
ncbi:hypothetical protein E0H88_10390 [Acinetobacter sp. ANC 4216]|uniref:hypothetical protein n=1 Tax=Acinetobacter sp. ANC 4216 TaxID=2529840 RepID=UPI00103ED14C|nr:hypothetical protein [Acinetobacter sp. ANC 4216]TCB69924.1 hypothetical protein E0H88_10390 [Acinetobacter sp. ANC 4216]